MPPAATSARRRRSLAALVLAALCSRSAGAAPAVQAPRPVHQVAATYPVEAASSEPRRVELLVTVAADGGVGDGRDAAAQERVDRVFELDRRRQGEANFFA